MRAVFPMRKTQEAVRERARYVGHALARRYGMPEIPLRHENPFTLLCAVVLSAQCTDKRVNAVTPALFALADTPQKMARCTVDEVNAIVRPCGLSPGKAKALVGLSQILVEKYGGKVPDTFEALESLPGVGHKTASVVMAQGFGKPAFPVDTHIFRLAHRWGLSEGKTPSAVEKDLKRLFSEKDWHALHLQIIYFGREFCKAHLCKKLETLCPMCRALAEREAKARRA